MDFNTVRAVWKKHRPHFFAPLGNKHHLESFGLPASHIHILDWWEDSSVSVALPPKDDTSPVGASFVVGCTPAQHVANRGLFDRWRTLWASWAVAEELPAGASGTPKKVFFGGDTGYRSVFAGEDEDAVPHCPAFAQIGERYGSFDLALLPIGSVALL